LYYTFRDGETAWLYARTLNVMHQFAGVTAFTLDPYQIGHENEEGIESGAFWFYRKLGFRPTQKALRQVVEAEEKKLARKPGYRTPAPTLRKIAAGHIVFELGTTQSAWDGFQIRNVGLAVQKRLAEDFASHAGKMKAAAVKKIAQVLNIKYASLNQSEQRLFENFAYLFSLVQDLNQWTLSEKRLAAQIIQAKMRASETQYLRLLQKHQRLRDTVIRLGS
jgi:hypothetical protein